MCEDAAWLGIELAQATQLAGDLVVLPQNWPIVRAFMAVQTQWRYATSGHRLGLDYAGCQAAVQALGVGWRQVFAGLQVMEAEVLASQS